MKSSDILVVLTLCALLGLFLAVWAGMPVVVVGHPSGRCLAVDGAGSCSELPPRYHQKIVSDDWRGEQ